MKPVLDLIIIIPVGPKCNIEFVLDTISSIKHYVHKRYRIIVADDSQNPRHAAQIEEQFPDIIILKNIKNFGKLMGLYKSLCNAYAYALREFDFDVLLRLDSDALVIGHSPELSIIQFFKNNPEVGIAGRYVKGMYSPDDFGNVWHNGGRELIVAIAKIFTLYFIRHPFIYWRIRKLLFRAISQGYELGELVFGGAYTMSRVALEKLRDNGLLPLKNVMAAELEEDHFFTLLIGTVGIKFGDLASGTNPFACTWRGLPASPEALYQANKKIIHSTRFWKEMNESEIRKYFRDKRESDHAQGS